MLKLAEKEGVFFIAFAERTIRKNLLGVAKSIDSIALREIGKCNIEIKL